MKVNFLSQIHLSHRGDGSKVAKRLVEVYFALFKVLRVKKNCVSKCSGLCLLPFFFLFFLCLNTRSSLLWNVVFYANYSAVSYKFIKFQWSLIFSYLRYLFLRLVGILWTTKREKRMTRNIPVLPKIVKLTVSHQNLMLKWTLDC